MREIVILVPDVDIEQNIEIDVRINGKKRTIQYRVELLSWEGNDEKPKDRVSTLRHYISEYNKGWELVEIGAPSESNIPVMFRRKRSFPEEH
jgi:hypothetical protein